MRTVGVTHRPLVVRFTEISASGVLGNSILRKGVFDITLVPVVEAGKEHRWPTRGVPVQIARGPDKFSHFEFSLRDRRLLRWDRELRRMLRQSVSLEFWTENGEGGYPWIHWVFPLTSWKRTGWRLHEGRSKHHGLASGHDFGAPDETPIPDGGWWKSMIAPPA